MNYITPFSQPLNRVQYTFLNSNNFRECPMVSPKWMVYGANGYTGQLVVEEALRRGHKPVVAGRNRSRLEPLAQKWDLDHLVFDLSDPREVEGHLSDVDLVFHSAGPFVFTSDPMIQACLATGTHYVDVTGEIPVFENTFSYHSRAVEKGVCLISGVGFDVVPSDCLARYVSDQLPTATALEIGIASMGGQASAGTTKTMIEFLPHGGKVRRNGEIVSWPLGAGPRRIPFPCGTVLTIPTPWGDVSTAYHTTSIPNITVFMSFPSPQPYIMRLAGPLLQGALSFTPVRRAVQKFVEKTVKGPDEAHRNQTRSYLWARASDSKGRSVQAWLDAVEGYKGTSQWGVRAVEHLLEKDLTGALTPSRAFGADFVLEIGDTRRLDSLKS